MDGLSDLPPDWFMEVTSSIVELHTMRENERCRSRQLQEKLELCDIEVQELMAAIVVEPSTGTTTELPVQSGDPEMTVEEMLHSRPHLGEILTEDDTFADSV